MAHTSKGLIMNQQTVMQSAACTLYRGTLWYSIYYFYNNYKSVLRTMYIVMFSCAHCDTAVHCYDRLSPFLLQQEGFSPLINCRSGSKHTFKTWSSTGISFSILPKKNSPVCVSHLDKYNVYHKPCRLGYDVSSWYLSTALRDITSWRQSCAHPLSREP